MPPSVVSLAQGQCAALIENMFGVTTSDDYRPVAWMGRYPVDVTTMLVGVHVGGCDSHRDSGGVRSGSILLWLQFDSAVIWSGGQVWRLFTYAFVHALALLWFAIEMYMLFVFGREVERFIGRRAYIALYVFLLITPPALLRSGDFGNGADLSGSFALHFGIFIAFATIYPRVELLLRIMAKWVALILAAIYTFQLLAYHAWSDLMVLWASIGVAFLFVELNGAGPELVWWQAVKERFAPRPKFQCFRTRERVQVATAQSRKTITVRSIRSSTKFPSSGLEASLRTNDGSWIASANDC